MRTLERSWSIVGNDSQRSDRYRITNDARQPTGHMNVMRLGGGFAHIGEVGHKAYRIVDGKRKSMDLDLDVNSERFRMWRARFKPPLAPGKSADVHIEGSWPRGMSYYRDACFISETLMYERGVDQLIVHIAFDCEVTDIEAWWWDLDSDDCAQDGNQPRQQTEGDSTAWTWTAQELSNSRIYFIVFDRGPPPKLAQSGTARA